ncbi:MAG: BofC C-terminal domain-containing protein [Butyribacter sp.]|nr:BofC C-terminal domain-containing protein [bacterium]MDY3854739.1 BofC C-terminal domain-containing protein [Butyribacter sp.]
MMNQKILWMAGCFGVIACVTAGSVMSYRFAVNTMEEMQTDYESRVSELVEVDVTKQLEQKAQEVVQETIKNNSDIISANSSEDALDINTVYQIQKYDVTKDTTTTEYETLPEELVGFTRKDVDAYCKEYMDILPVEEYLAGLQSIGVSSFSKERLVIKKIYDSSKVTYQYYLIAVEGEVVVYYGDKKTVYEYTGIETKNLTKEETTALKKGIEVKDEKELFSILENYTS